MCTSPLVVLKSQYDKVMKENADLQERLALYAQLNFELQVKLQKLEKSYESELKGLNYDMPASNIIGDVSRNGNYAFLEF